MTATQIRRGNVLVLNGDPCRVLDFHHHTPGNQRGFVQTKLRNIRTGISFDQRFRSTETVERAYLQTQELQYLYSDGTHHHFMNSETFDQLELDDETLGDAAAWLTPNMIIEAEFYEGRPIGVELPGSLELEVVETEPSARGDTKTAGTKPAKLENGVTIQVPPFVNQGDKIRVDPREERYLERVLR